MSGVIYLLSRILDNNLTFQGMYANINKLNANIVYLMI